MFRKYIVIAVFTLTISGSYAQRGLRIGPSASVVSSRAHVVDTLPSNFNFRYKSGFNAGLAFQYGFTDRFTLGWGLSYTNKGYRVFNDSNRGGTLLKHNVGNLELPVNAILKMRLGSTSRMRFLGGVTLNYQISAKEKELRNKNSTFIIKEKSIKPVYPMLNLGVEIASEGKSGNIFIFGVYYKQSFSNQLDLSIYNTSDLSKNRYFAVGYRGSYIGIGISYLFDIKNFKRSEEFFY